MAFIEIVNCTLSDMQDLFLSCPLYFLTKQGKYNKVSQPQNIILTKSRKVHDVSKRGTPDFHFSGYF